MHIWFIYILLLLIQPITVICQSRWTNVYYGEKDAYADYFIESYDCGYLIMGRHGSSYPHFNWLIKTDINGQILWEKTIGEANSYSAFACLADGLNGELYLSGSTTFYDEMQDPIILKLDSCGEKQWCKVFHNPGYLDYAFHVLATDDGGCVALLFSGYDPQIDRICLARLDIDGDLLWKDCYNSQDTSLMNAFAQSFIRAQDGGFLITGHCGYEDPNQPNLFWSKPYYIKTDSLGNFEWEVVVHKDVGSEKGGSAWSTSINPSGTYYYSSISHYYPGSKSPALLKMDLIGNVIDIYDIVYGYAHSGLTYATFINDSTLAAGVGWGNTVNDIMNYAVLIDTIGNIKDSTFLVQDIYTIYMDTVYDNKLVYMYNTYQSGQFDVYLRKLNQNLEDDTLYTYPFQYDTLCPYPIASDTIVLDDCGLIVGMEEVKPEKAEEQAVLKVYPNPAQNKFKVQCLKFKVGLCVIKVFDIFGRKVKEKEIPKGQNEIEVDVEGWRKGLYLIRVRDENSVIGSGKVIVN
jgi:hypothetical protein